MLHANTGLEEPTTPPRTDGDGGGVRRRRTVNLVNRQPSGYRDLVNDEALTEVPVLRTGTHAVVADLTSRAGQDCTNVVTLVRGASAPNHPPGQTNAATAARPGGNGRSCDRGRD